MVVKNVQVFFNTIEKQYTFAKNSNENAPKKTAWVIGGRLTADSVHALCVFLCTPLFEPK